MNHFKISNQLIEQLKETKNPQQLNRVIYQLNNYIKSGYDPTDMNYFLFNDLIQREGISKGIVYTFLLNLVQHSQFCIKKDNKHFPTETVMTYLAGSSYWLDKDLFHPELTYQKITPQMSSGQKNLIQLLDLGCLLLSKGFQFPNPEAFHPQMKDYALTYIQMVQKRNKKLSCFGKNKPLEYN